MKKKLLLSIIAFIAITMSSAAYAQISNEAAGTYNGQLTVILDDSPMDPTLENVYLTATDDTHINLEIRNFTFGGTSMGDILVPEVALQQEGNTINLIPKEAQMNLIVGPVTIKLGESTIVNKRLVLTLNVKAEIDLKIDVTFDGTKTGGSGINDIAAEKPTVYYNPATSALVVKGADNQMYSIYNVTGVQALSGVLNTEEVSVSTLSRGLYLIKIGNTTVKFIKK